MEKGWLRATELIITSVPKEPLQVLEKYTFDFYYGSETVCSISMPDGRGSLEISSDTVRKDIRSVLKRIIELDRVLPRLPANRFLAVQLHYTDDVPEHFNPPGFQDASSTILQVDHDQGWNFVETKFGGIATEDYK